MDSKQPLHRRIHHALTKDLVRWRAEGRERLPDLDELCARFKASQMTVKKALKALAADGLVDRVQGKGTFIRFFDGSTAPDERDFISVIMPANPCWKFVLRAFKRAVAAAGYRTTFHGYQWSNVDEEARALEIARREAAAVLLCPNMFGNDEALIARSRAAGVPCVVFDPAYDDYPGAVVAMPHQRFTAEITDVEASRGRRVILASAFPEITVRARNGGYLDGLKERQAPLRFFLDGEWAGTERELENALISDSTPATVIVMGDEAFFKVCRIVNKHQVPVPAKLEIIVFEDVPWAGFALPEYRCVTFDQEKLGSVLAKTMLAEIKGEGMESIRFPVEYKLEKRRGFS